VPIDAPRISDNVRPRILRTEEWSQASTPARSLLDSVSTARRAELRRTRACIRPDPFGQGFHFRVPAPVGGDHTTRYNDVRQLLPTTGCWTRPTACSFAYGSSNLCVRVASIQSASRLAELPRRRADVRATPLITARTPVAPIRSDPSGSIRLNAAHLYSSDPRSTAHLAWQRVEPRRDGPTQSWSLRSATRA
jgi:hypothetical protein